MGHNFAACQPPSHRIKSFGRPDDPSEGSILRIHKTIRIISPLITITSRNQPPRLQPRRATVKVWDQIQFAAGWNSHVHRDLGPVAPPCQTKPFPKTDTRPRTRFGRLPNKAIPKNEHFACVTPSVHQTKPFPITDTCPRSPYAGLLHAPLWDNEGQAFAILRTRPMLDRITVHGARQHNLKNIDVEIPRNSLTVITGLSGSGKSSLAFDTIYAEGQRRYVETLSPYARQFLDQMERPEVDSIDGLSPAISIEQKTTSRSPRSTVGTITEIYDYLRLLYSSIGTPHCPLCGNEISRQTTDRKSVV